MSLEIILNRIETIIKSKTIVALYIITLLFSLLLIFDTAFFKVAAYLNIYQGSPLVVYVEKELAYSGFGSREEWETTVNFENKETKNLALVRVDNIYQLHYMPEHLKKYPNPEQAWATLLSIGYYGIDANKDKKWIEISMAADAAPYVEFPKGFSSLKLKLFETFARSKSGKAAIWVDQDLAEMINLAPYESSKESIDSKKEGKYIKLYPVMIKATGEGYTFIDKETTSNEQTRYNYPAKIIVGIHKKYVSKIEFDH